MSHKFNPRDVMNHLDDEDFLDDLEVSEKFARKRVKRKVKEEDDEDSE